MEYWSLQIKILGSNFINTHFSFQKGFKSYDPIFLKLKLKYLGKAFASMEKKPIDIDQPLDQIVKTRKEAR